MTQFGFFFDQSRCTGCHACAIVCKSWNDLPPGPVKWMRVYQWEKHLFPNVRINTLAIPCFHCDDPLCRKACPGNAIHKEVRFGAVLVDAQRCEEVHRDEDCRRCWQACPYGAPQFADDNPRATMSKCTMCVDRLYEGLRPICVLSCSLRALDFDTMDKLRSWYGPGKPLEDLPAPAKPKPAVIFKPHDAKRQLVPWDAGEALELWRGRGPNAPAGLPPLFATASDVLDIAPDTIGRHELPLKARGADELMAATRDDD